MITHEEAKEKLEQIAETHVYHFATYDEDGYCNDDDWDEYPVSEDLIKVMTNYIDQQETLQAEHEALKKDVARYFELRNKANMFFMEHTDELRELWALEEKLSKVGKI